MWTISDAVIINHPKPFSDTPLCKNTVPPMAELPARESACQGSCPALSCLSAQVAHTNATVCLSLLKSCRNNKPYLIKGALHGCMIYSSLHGGRVLMPEVWCDWLWGLLVTLDDAERNLLSLALSQSDLLCIQVGLWVAVAACEDMHASVYVWMHVCEL